MATVIRFARHGSKKKPYYRIVVQDQRAPRDGRFIEHIGAYNPIKGAETLSVQRDRLEYWLSTGAKMSDSVGSLLRVKMREWRTGSATGPALTPPSPKKPKAAKKEEAPEA